jgi:phosphoribosylglycinamide formyltransferase-1
VSLNTAAYTMHKLVLFASGSGSNVENIANYFEQNNEVKVAAVFTNKTDAGVIERCKRLGIPCYSFTNAAYLDPSFIDVVKSFSPRLIVLAGFLKKISPSFVKAFENKIVNVHPALLPKFGGKGMYGMNVHKAVVSAGEIETGITIHWVDEIYDNGATISQFRVRLDGTETPEEVAQKVHELEYQYFPKTIESLL